MASTVTAFGYSVPLVVVLVFVALVVGLALAVTFLLTVGWSIRRSVRDTRRQRVRDDLQRELMDRLFDDEPEWGAWVADLSGVERDVTELLLDECLRDLAGAEAERLRELGVALEIPDRARRRLETRREHTRLTALTWLALLREPGPLRTADFTPRTSRERAAVVRLRHESGDLTNPREGIVVLLEGTSRFTVFGQDTLYRLATADPDALFETAASAYQTWSATLVVQVLRVCQHLQSGVTVDDLSWLTATAEHENEAVRAAAARALGNLGWRRDVRDEQFVDRLRSDPSPRVRRAVYEMLGQWGDDRALGVLREALEDEGDERARLAGTEVLVNGSTGAGPRGDDQAGVDDVSQQFESAWTWSLAHAEYDRAVVRPGASR